MSSPSDEETIPYTNHLTPPTRTMIDAYEFGRDPAATLAALAIWLGHTSPAYTYWYLQAVPELAAIAARRLEPEEGSHS